MNATPRTRVYRPIALTSDESTCEFCGKTDLQKVVVFEELETGALLHTGTTCAETVQLLVVDESGEAKPRKAREILTMAQRAVRTAAIDAALNVYAWRVAEFVIHMRGEENSKPFALDLYTSAAAARGVEVASVPWVAFNANLRDRAIVAAARSWAKTVDAVNGAKSLSKREALIADAELKLSELRKAAPRTEV